MLNLRNDRDQKSTKCIKRADQTKRWIAWLLCFALLALPSAALAEGEEPTATPSAELTATPEALPSAAPLTGELAFELPEDEAQYAYRLTDEQVVSRISLKAEQAFSFSFEPSRQGVLLSWYTAPAEYVVSQTDASGVSLGETTVSDGMLNKYLELDPACTRVTVTLLKEGAIADVSVYGADEELPASVQRWEPTPDKADLLLIAAEPGAEWKELGGALTNYTFERGVKTAILYVSDFGKRERAEEALSTLWAMGVREYPLFAGFTCSNYDSYDMVTEGYRKASLPDYLTQVITALSPKVIVTHGLAETQAAHRYTAEQVVKVVTDDALTQKLYCFGQMEGQSATTLDLSQPLNAFGGKTAVEAAQSAYELHLSQHVYGWTVDSTGAFTLAYTSVGDDAAKDDLLENISTSALISYTLATPSPAPTSEPTSTPLPTDTPAPQQTTAAPVIKAGQVSGKISALVERFGAAALSLGIGLVLTVLLALFGYSKLRKKFRRGDVICFCLIPLAVGLTVGALLSGVQESKESAAALEEARIAAEATPEPTPTATPEPTPSATPEATEAPVETVADDSGENYYRREGEPEEVILVDEENGRWEYRTDELGITIDRVSATNAEGKPLTYFVADIHMKNIYQFRAGFGSEGHTGRGAIYPWLIARRAKAVLWITGDNLINSEKSDKGVLIRDGRIYSDNQAEDTLALYPDMTMHVYGEWEMRARDLLEDGVENSFSFGPTLINDGVVNENAKYHRVRRINPRTGIGYISPGHFICIVVDGRQKNYSVGMTIWEFADLFVKYNCSIAYNLDGGLSAGMIFMGEQLNSHSGQRIGEKNDISYQRAVPDGLMFGYSDQVPSEDDPIANNGNKSK